MPKEINELIEDLILKIDGLGKSLTEEVHALNLGMVRLGAEVKSINENLGSRVDRLETEYAFLGNEVRVNKSLIHEHDKTLVKFEALPEEIQKQRHRISQAEQKILIMEENNNVVHTEEMLDRINVLEKSVILIEDHMDNVKENTKTINNQKAFWYFLNSKPGWAIIIFVCGVVAYKLGIGIAVK